MRFFGHYISRSIFVLGFIEISVLVVSIYAAQFLRWADLDQFWPWIADNAPKAITFTAIFWLTMVALGVYHRDVAHDRWMSFVRLLVSFAVGFVLLSMVIYVVPDLNIWRSFVAIAVPLSLALIVLIRLVFLSITGIGTFKRKILVLGTGTLAGRIVELEQQDRSSDFVCVGFVRVNDSEPKVDPSKIFANLNSLVDFAKSAGVEEIVVALEERRGGFPMEQLLACKSSNIRITEYTTFWERETGQVDLDTLRPSWIVFSDGFVGGPVQAVIKRLFDVTASLLLLVFSLPILALTALAVRFTSRGPVLYRQERVGRDGNKFMLLKFRSMEVDAEADGTPRWAGQRDPRVTSVGRFIRKSRIDEIPQIFNVLRGDMSFIGPRPERPFFVDTLAQQVPYYRERHQVKPGISGWAQLNYPYGASVDDAKMKLRYDLYYIKNYSVFLDLIVMMQTVRVVLWPDGAR